jgi:hypothetical protein
VQQRCRSRNHHLKKSLKKIESEISPEEKKKKGVGRERKDDEGYGNTHTHIRIASVGWMVCDGQHTCAALVFVVVTTSLTNLSHISGGPRFSNHFSLSLSLHTYAISPVT